MNKLAVVVAAVFLAAASAVEGFAIEDTIGFMNDLKEAVIPYQSCDGASFSNTEGCIYSADYWATHHAQSSFPETNMPWPAPANGMCYDYYRGFAVGVHAAPGPIPQNIYEAWPNDTAAVLFLFNETTELLSQISVPLSNTYRTPQFFNVSGTSHLDLLTQPATSVCRRIAKEYITATLNICNQACHGLAGGLVDEAMKLMANALFHPVLCYNNPEFDVPLSASPLTALNLLHDFNTGAVDLENGECTLKYGPPVCGTVPTNRSFCDTQTDAPCFGDYCNGGCTMPESMWTSAKKKPLDWADFCPQAWMSSVPNFSNTLQTTPYYNAPEFTWGQIMDAKDYDETCIIAAKQHIAAQLNIECFAACSTETVDSVMTELDALLNANCLTLNVGKKNGYINGFGSANTTDRRRALLLSDYLKSYNTGRYVGPGTCDLQDSLVLASIMASGSSTAAGSDSSVYHPSEALVIAGFIFLCISVTFIGCILASYCYMLFNRERASKHESKESGDETGKGYMHSEQSATGGYSSRPRDPFATVTRRLRG